MTRTDTGKQRDSHPNWREIDAKAHKDASEGRYDPPSGWFAWVSSGSAGRDVYDSGWHDAKADVPKSPDLHGAFLRRTDLSFANLESANLSRADFTNAIFRGANFKNANLTDTILHGANLSNAANLTVDQLSKARVDERTVLPDGITLDQVRRVGAQ